MRFSTCIISVGISALILVGSLSGCSGSDKPKFEATLRYTSYGVPHIQANDFKGAAYAYGYAFAKDNVCLWAEELVTMHGERAKYFGEAGGYLGQLGDSWSNVNSDFFYKLIFTNDLAATFKTNASADAQELATGYVAGYNRYLREAGTNLPTECKDQAWVQPMTENDAYWRFAQAAMTGSSMAFIESIGRAQPPAAVAATKASHALAQTPQTSADFSDSEIVQSINRLRDHVVGSNGYGLGRDVTENGKGLVMGNPHFPWWGALRLNQVHMTVPSKNYDVYGATLLGVPLPLIGFNDKVAWTHTFSTDNRFTLRLMSLDPTDPTKYMKDGISKAMTAVPLSITAKAADGSTKTISRTLYRTEYGPMLMDSSFAWGKSMAFAIQDANYSNYKMIEEVVLNGQSTDVASLRTAGATFSAIPWVNVMAADKKGDVLFGNFSVAANVNDLQLAKGACVPGAESGAPFYDLMNSVGLVVMAGSVSACDWSGWIEGARRPSVTRSDYVVNANDSHWWPSLNTFLTGYAKIIATGSNVEGAVQGERTRTGHAMVRDRRAGADGVAGNKFTMANLQQLYLQARFFRAEKWLPEFVAACQTSTSASPDAKDACTVLASWDMKHGMTSSGAVLFREFYEKLDQLTDAKWWSVPYKDTDPLETPRGAASTTDALALLEKLVLDPQFNSPLKRRARPTDVQLLLRDNAPLAIPGGRWTFNNWRGQKTLDPFGSGNYIYTADPKTNAGAYGNSYIQFVTWDDAGPVAEGMLTYSQSSQPSSEHFSDLTKVYAAGKWVKLPYTQAQIAADLQGSPVDLSE